MTKTLERLWARRPRLSRGQKTARNLLLSGLFVLWFWGVTGYPLPTVEMEFRRAERQHMMPNGAIILWREDMNYIHVASETEARINMGRYSLEDGYWTMASYAKTGQVTVVPFGGQLCEENGIRSGLLAVGLPPETEQVRLKASWDGTPLFPAGEGVAQGELQGDGLAIFRLETDRPAGTALDWTLVSLPEDGAPAVRWNGVTRLDG